MEKNPEVWNMLEASIAEAKKINPDLKTNPVQSLTDYYDFIDKESECQYKDAFANGVLTQTFLNVNDYHRYHFAVSGTIKERIQNYWWIGLVVVFLIVGGIVLKLRRK